MNLPAPLTPIDCDLRDFAFMPLDVVRLRDSDLASEQTPEENWAAVLLWAAAWHQVPAGSMPDSDNWIAKAAGYLSRGVIDPHWKDVREGAMRGFILCGDGRWYHPVVAEKASEAWTAKLRQRLKTECARIKKHNDRHGTRIPFPEFDAWLQDGCPTGQSLHVPKDTPPLSQGTDSNIHPLSLDDHPYVPTQTPSKGQGEGQGQGQGELTTTTPDGVVVASQAGNLSTSRPQPAARPECPHQQIIALYHDILPECPQVRDWTPARQQQLRTRWNEDPRRQNLDYWRKFFEYVKGCAFLVGRGTGKNDRPFLADLEWLTKSKNFVKIREGKYE
jgi:hypothetical protein